MDLVDRDPPRALALYSGRFLPGRGDEIICTYRERLAQRYIATLSAYAQDYENSDRHQAALALYQAGLQMESGCEVFYQGVMRCELQLGRPMEAARAYDALTQVLSNQPDSRPSQVTEKIYEKVRQATQVQTRSQ